MLGVFFSVATLAVMFNSYKFTSGVVFDCRSVLLGIAGLFCGPLVALMAAVSAASYRLFCGGAGVLMGVSVILSSSGIGIIFYYLKRRRSYLTDVRYLYVFGLIIHLVMLGMMVLLPSDIAIMVYKDIAIPVIILFPIGTVLLGMMLKIRREKIR